MCQQGLPCATRLEPTTPIDISWSSRSLPGSPSSVLSSPFPALTLRLALTVFRPTIYQSPGRSTMKTQVSVIAILTLAALANSQSREDIPSCARPCLDDAIKSTTSCAIDDFACVCKNFGSIQGAAVSCVLAKCGQDTALNKVLPATKQLCEGVKSI
ncbi:hypothetical protein B0I37DRAFT_158667 [Chaetomium sp. MPI-CAGE-AT-0009]|nr:hypothetical protein B0I37DRAFT_158667 [Chaetomium sp. MPI-CAGE-AT-0009]